MSDDTDSHQSGERKPADHDPSESGRLEEREERQHGVQQHGDTFSVESDQPTDTSGIPPGSNRVSVLPGNEPSDEHDDD